MLEDPMTLHTNLARLRRCRWNATADLLDRDHAAAPARAKVLLRMPMHGHTPQDKRALAALRRIAGGK